MGQTEFKFQYAFSLESFKMQKSIALQYRARREATLLAPDMDGGQLSGFCRSNILHDTLVQPPFALAMA
jgi:hypothetical protein